MKQEYIKKNNTVKTLFSLFYFFLVTFLRSELKLQDKISKYEESRLKL